MRQCCLNFKKSQELLVRSGYRSDYWSKAYYRELVAVMKEKGLDEAMGHVARKHLLENHPYEIDYEEAAYRFDIEIDYYVDEMFNDEFEIEDIKELDYEIAKSVYWELAWERFKDKLLYRSADYIDLILPR